MRRLLPIALALLLLCGCSYGSAPTEPSLLTEPALTEPSEPPAKLILGQDGDLTVFDTEGGNCAGLLPMGEGYVLLTADGSVSLLTGEELTVVSTAALGCPLSANDPSITVMDDRISYYDPQREAYITLGKNLTEISALTIQDEITAGPIMAPDFSAIYYGTASGIRAMDMATGNSRLLRQEQNSIVSLDGLLFDGTILRYIRLDSENQAHTCFIRTADGTQVYLADLNGEVVTWGQRYAAVMTLEQPVSTCRQILTGTVGQEGIQLLNIRDTWDRVLFPGEGTALVQTLSEDVLVIALYDLDSGALLGTHDFPERTEAFSGAWMENGGLWLFSGEESRFLRWNLSDIHTDESHLTRQYTLTDPDQEGLDSFKTQLQALSGSFGVPIRFTDSSIRTNGVDYSGYPDCRPGQYTQALSLLEEAMEQFPSNFFSRLADRRNLVIELVDDYDPAAQDYAGTGEMTLADETVIRVSICADLQAILYHQLFHLMELDIHGQTGELTLWLDANPEGFDYSGSYSDYAQGLLEDSPYLTPGSNYFADAYALVSAREDRAQTFLYAMLPDREELFRSEAMQTKLRLLCDGIRDTFDYEDTETSFLWEQYLAE